MMQQLPVNWTWTHEIQVEEFNLLRRSAGWPALEAEQAAIGLRQTQYQLCVREQQGRAIAMARVVGDGGYVALICDVVVLPEYQHRGIATQMLERILAWLRSGLRPGQTVCVQLMASRGLEGFYERFGFISRPTAQRGAGMMQNLHYAEQSQAEKSGAMPQ